MPARVTITSLFEQVAREQQRELSPLSDDLKLLQLDSLSFALIVARLDGSLGYNPFDATAGARDKMLVTNATGED
jgi:hypothetical protein